MLIPTLTLKSKINKNAKIQDMETKNAPQIMSAKENLVNICLFLSYQFYCHKMWLSRQLTNKHMKLINVANTWQTKLFAFKVN